MKVDEISMMNGLGQQYVSLMVEMYAKGLVWSGSNIIVVGC